MVKFKKKVSTVIVHILEDHQAEIQNQNILIEHQQKHVINVVKQIISLDNAVRLKQIMLGTETYVT